jgi:predicted ester cyclase
MTEAPTLIERLFAVLDSHRWDDIDTVVHPDSETTTPMGQGLSRDAWIEINRSFAVAAPDGRHTLQSVIEDGDRYAAEGVWTGTQTGPMATPGGELPPTGRALTLPFCTTATRRGDRLASVTVYFDQLAMLAQLGLVPEPAATH